MIISSMKIDIKDQRKFLLNKEIFWVMQKCCLKKLINQFSNENIILKDEKFYNAPKKSEKKIY